MNRSHSAFFFGFIAGAFAALIFVGSVSHAAEPIQQPDMHPVPQVTETWGASSPGQDHEPDHLQPPRGSFGVVSCDGQYAIWVFLADGKSYRYDSKSQKLKTKEELGALMAWLNTGPTDVVPFECRKSGATSV